MKLAGGSGNEDVVELAEVPAAGESLAERRQGESHRATGLLSEDGGPHRLEPVVVPVVGPLDGKQLVALCPLLDLPHALGPPVRSGPRATAAALPDTAEEDGLPD